MKSRAKAILLVKMKTNTTGVGDLFEQKNTLFHESCTNEEQNSFCTKHLRRLGINLEMRFRTLRFWIPTMDFSAPAYTPCESRLHLYDHNQPKVKKPTKITITRARKALPGFHTSIAAPPQID